MSEFLRYDSADYKGTLTGVGGIFPGTNNLSKSGIQAIDCRHFNSLSLQLSGTWTATAVIEQSNDGVAWSVVGSTNTAVAASATSINSNGIYVAPLNAKYARVRFSAWTSGTATIFVTVGSAVAQPVVPSQLVTLGAGTTVTPSPSTAAGSGAYSHIMSAAGVNATLVKATPAVINSIILSNTTASAAYFKLYDKASAPVVGTDTPIMSVLVPASGTICLTGGYTAMRMPTGLAYAITGGIPVADTTAIAANQIIGTINYT